MTKHYFALDGSYGEADRFVLLDTTDWTEENWNDIENATDNQRIDVATAIDSEHLKIKLNSINDGFDPELPESLEN